MKRIILLLRVAAMMAVMMVASAAPAFAAPTWKDRDGNNVLCTWGWGGSLDHCYNFGPKPGKG